MALVMDYSSEWFDKQSSSTGTPGKIKHVPKVLMATALSAVVGTGVYMDDLQMLQQYQGSHGSFFGAARLPIAATTTPATPAELIKHIRTILLPSATDMANVFGVSRQTIYNWLKGEQPGSSVQARLEDMGQAAELLAHSGLRASGLLLKRKVISGKSVFEVAREGGSARQAMEILLQVVQREQEQRAMLNSRYASRKNASPAVEADFPAENE